MIGDTEMSVLIYDACTLRRMEMLRARGLCGIRRGEDKHVQTLMQALVENTCLELASVKRFQL